MQTLADQRDVAATMQQGAVAEQLLPPNFGTTSLRLPSLLTIATQTLKKTEPELVKMIRNLDNKDERIVETVLKDMKSARLTLKQFAEILRACETRLIVAGSALELEAPEGTPG